MTRTGIGYDSHCLRAGRPLIIGGVTIPYPQGLAGHSDADVLMHAVCDALLGAIADGDIGTHFPDTDPRWKGADSGKLLQQVAARIFQQGWQIQNVDATVVAEAPKLAAYIPAMRARLASILEVDITAISVKAKTNEGLDAIGRHEGIAALAVATVMERCEIAGEREDGDL